MKYNKQVKSLYELFKDYPKEFIDIVLKRFRKAKSSMELLQKKFGPKFDGKDRDMIIFSYADDFKLDSILFRIEELLKFMLILQEKENKSLVVIEHIILDKNDSELIAYQKNILSKEKDAFKNSDSIVSKTQLIRMLQASEDVLSNALMLHENQDERIAFKYYYGIHTEKKNLEEVSQILGVAETKVLKYVDNVIKEMPKLLKEYKSTRVKEIPVKKEITKSALKENNNIRNTEIFWEYFITDNMSVEEQDLVKAKLNLIIEGEIKKQVESFILLKQILTNGLETNINLKKLTNEQKCILNKCKKTIKKYINLSPEEIKIILKVNLKIKNKDKTFMSYFVNDNMTLEEQELIKQKVNLIIDIKIKKQVKSFIDLKQMLANGLETSISEIQNINVVYSCNRLIKKYLNKDINELKKEYESPVKIKKKLQTLLDYFVNDSMTLEEQDLIRQKVNLIIELKIKKQVNSFVIFRHIFPDGLDTNVNLITLTDEQKYTLRKCQMIIAKYIDLSLEEIAIKLATKPKAIKIKTKIFLDYFINEDMTLEEQDLIKQKIKLIIDLEIKKQVVSFSELEQILINGVETDVKSLKLTREQKYTLKNCRKIIAKYIDLSLEELTLKLKSKKKVKDKKKKSKTFLSYFVNEDMSLEQKNIIREKVELIMALENSVPFKKIQTILTNGLDSEIVLKNLSKTTINYLYSVIKVIRQYLSYDKETIVETINGKIKSLTLMDYFIKQEASKDEISELERKLEQILLDYRDCENQYAQVIIAVTNGDIHKPIDKFENNIQRSNFYVGIKQITKILQSGIYKKRKKCMLDYLTESELTSQELTELKVKYQIVMEYKVASNVKHYQLINNLTQGDIKALIDFKEFNRSDKVLFRDGVKSLKRYLDLSLDEIKVKFNIKNLLECLTSQNLEFLEVQKLQQKVYEELANNQFPEYAIISKLTHKKVLTNIKFYELSQQDLDLFNKGLVILTKRLNMDDKRAKSFMSYIEKNQNEELAILRKKVELIFKTKKSKSLINLKSLLNNGIDSMVNTSKFNKKEQKIFYNGIRYIKLWLNKEIIASQISEEKDNLIDKNEIYEEYKTLKTDLVIYRDIQDGLSIDNIISLHQYSLDTVLTSLIDNIEIYDVNKLVLYIATNYPTYIAMLLSSNYFAPYLKELTLKEQKLIYLKLLALSNSDITDSIIADTLGLSIEDVKEYQIMSKYDEINALNLVLKK